ncbi:alpha-xenorhabdolysin family binary toxin subunit A [Nonomuraea polychroma]|uniref:alpha-xenorhabdolysin family binary toxin subunit A n=1 Tax=Nonomuraea polychroma TaxID=46176 RepID=UPI003D9349D2
MGETSRINGALFTPKEIDTGIAVLNLDEWRKLQAFADMAVSTNPATEEAMRQKLKLASGKELGQDFKETVKIYASLKANCTVFKDKIRPGTVDLANDIVQYQRQADVLYERLIRLIEDYQAGRDTAAKLAELEAEWRKDRPSPEAADIKTKFQKYVERLWNEAKERAEKATALEQQVKEFRSALEVSHAEFARHAESYKDKYGGAEKGVERIKGDIAVLEQELASARKKDKDERIVLATAPVYLVIPFFGPFIMSGVLLGVGIDLGLQVERIKEKVKRLEAEQNKLDTEQTFFADYKTGMQLTEQTAKDIAVVLPLVGKIAAAWSALTSDLEHLNGALLKDAAGSALAEDWDFTSIDLETARETWRDLKKQADDYRRFAVAEPVETAEALASGMKAAA